MNRQCLVNQILLAGHDVCDVAQTIGGVRACVHMDMNPAAFIAYSARGAQLSHKLLYGGDVVIDANRAYKFDRFGFLPRVFALYVDAAVTYKLPSTALIVVSRKIVAVVIGPSPEMLRRNLRRTLTGKTGHLDLDAEFLLFQIMIHRPFRTTSPGAAGL